MITNRLYLVGLLCFLCPVHTIAQTDYYYYKGNRVPLTVNENKVVVSIPKECDETCERIRANVNVLGMVEDETFDILVIARSDYEHLTSMNSWEEDAKSVILTSCYITENNEEICASPYLNVRLKNEQDRNLLTMYAEEYKLKIVYNIPYMPLWYILSLTLDSEKEPLQIANELYETGNLAESVADLVALDSSIEPEPLEPVIYTQGQMATIILPEEPEASKGKYYRLDRVEGNEIIFEQELQPRAHIPYIIVPGEDFSIELGTLDLNGLSRDTVSIDGVSFIGTYQKEEIESKEGFYIDIIDATPDCILSDNTVKVGALRAFLQVHWDDPYSHGGTKAPAEKMQIVLHDRGTGIKTLSNSPLKGENIYDLNGRIVNGKWSNGKLPHGIYIKDGRKRLKK